MPKKLLAATALVSSIFVSPAYGQEDPSAAARSGDTSSAKQVLADMQCRPNEKKLWISRGSRDDFDPAGSEPAQISAAVAQVPHLASSAKSNYDETQVNKKFFDQIEIPSNISKGIVFVGLKPIGELFDNDNLVIGDVFSNYSHGPATDYFPGDDDISKRMVFSSRINELPSNGWTQNGSVFTASFDQLDLKAPGTTFLDYVQSGSTTTAVDVYVQDDTSVDFFAVAVCQTKKFEPAGELALTWTARGVLGKNGHNTTPALANPDYILVGSDPDSNPHKGDTDKARERRLLCYVPGEVSTPASYPTNYIERKFYYGWGGGQIGLSEPVKGVTVTSKADADAQCKKDLQDDGARIISFHESGGGWNVGGTLHPNSKAPILLRNFDKFFKQTNKQHHRYWVYIRDQSSNLWD